MIIKKERKIALKSNKILYVITKSDWGGAQKHLYDLIYCNKNHEEILVVVGNRGDLTEKLDEINVKYEIINDLSNSISPLKDYRALLKIKKIVRSFNPDVVHLHSSKAGLLGRIASYFQRNKPKIIFTAHGWGFTPGTKFKNKILSLFTEYLTSWMLDKIICVSEYDKQIAQKYRVKNKKHIVSIYNGVSIPKGKFKFKNVNDRRVVFTMVARFDSQKDYELLVEAIYELKKKNIEMFNLSEFNFVGKGPLFSKVEKTINDKNLSSNINLMGFREDVIDIVGQSDVFLLISKYEGLPISIIEGLSLSKPIISSNVGGVSELINENGFLINKNLQNPQKEISEILNALETYLKMPELIKTHGENSYKLFLENFTIQSCINKTFTLYNSLVMSKKGIDGK